jgi:glycosyltransferase involved in cell wall biosynthesis
MTTPSLSIIICTRDPRRDYLERTLAALRDQWQAANAVEMILVDNHSSPPLASWINLQGLPGARVVIEEEPGFTPALIRGVREATGAVCVLVHDDNVLAEDYLAQVERIAGEWPQLGAWGGQYEAEYEEPPDPTLAPFIAYLAVNSVARDRWSNALYDYPATPCGAGMAVRTSVLRHYAELVTRDERRRSLGRHTNKLTSCEDFDIAFTAIDRGLGTGVFTCLKIRHLIPRGRVQLDYLRRLVEGHGYSSVLLHSFRGAVTPAGGGLVARLRHWRYLRKLAPAEREVKLALARGEARAFALLAGQKVTS